LVPTFASLRAWRFFFLMAAVWLRGLVVDRPVAVRMPSRAAKGRAR